MGRILAGALWLFLLASASARAAEYPLPPQLIALQSPPGRAMLLAAEGQKSFAALLSQFVSQDTQQFCGVASSVIVLNALGVPAPVDPRYAPYKYFTQDNFFTPQVAAVAPRNTVDCNGMTVDQLAAILRLHGAAAQIVHADETTVAAFRKAMRAALARDGTYVIANYQGGSLGLTETTGGHFSPLAAYDARTDRFLILDVSRYVYPPYWIKAAALFAAMNTVDTDNTSRRRGYVIVSRPLASNIVGTR